jgi:hypothetical protein
MLPGKFALFNIAQRSLEMFEIKSFVYQLLQHVTAQDKRFLLLASHVQVRSVTHSAVTSV